jgi:alpha-mannosidase
VVRDPYGHPELPLFQGIEAVPGGPLSQSLRAVFAAHGHPRIEVTYTLFAREKRLDVAIALLKDPTPLLEAYAAFPFDLPQGRFRYEGPLCVVDPARDLLPGAFADRVTVQNWVAISDGAHSILWSSHDAPVASLAQLWPGRISPAHSAVVRADLVHPCQRPKELCGGAIYSLLAANNFGTNVAVSQAGALCFRYSLTSLAGAVTDGAAARWGSEVLTPLSTIFTKHPGSRPLPPVAGVLVVEPADVQLVALKRAEDGVGWIARLWNPCDREQAARVVPCSGALTAAGFTNLAEEDTGEPLAIGPDGLAVPLAARAVATVRLQVEWESDNE